MEFDIIIINNNNNDKQIPLIFMGGKFFCPPWLQSNFLKQKKFLFNRGLLLNGARNTRGL